MMNDGLQEPIAMEPLLKSITSNGNGHSTILEKEIEALNQQSRRMQQLIEQVDEIKDLKVKELVQDCIQEILTFYGNGIERIINILMHENSSAATKIINDLIGDSFINGLLLIHDLHPFDLHTRLNLALEKVRPYMDSHGGNVEIVSLENGTACLRLSGTCKGCASSSLTLELAIKQAIEEYCPDLQDLQVDGVVEPASKKPAANLPKQATVAPEWQTVAGLENLAENEIQVRQLNGVNVVICKANGKLVAYRDGCPACEMPLSKLEGAVICCRLGHGYNVLLAGVCTADDTFHLTPVPLIIENGVVKLAVG